MAPLRIDTVSRLKAISGLKLYILLKPVAPSLQFKRPILAFIKKGLDYLFKNDTYSSTSTSLFENDFSFNNDSSKNKTKIPF